MDFLAEIPVNEPEVTFDETVVVHEINVVESGLSEALAASAAGKQPQYTWRWTRCTLQPWTAHATGRVLAVLG